MKRQLKTPPELISKLYPFVNRTAKATCMSEIEGLLEDILNYLVADLTNTRPQKVDITIMDQLDLDIPAMPEKPDMSWIPVSSGLYCKEDK